MQTTIATVPMQPPVPAQADSDDQVVAMWLARSESPHTRRAYERTAGQFLEHAGRPLAQVRVGDVQAFVGTLEGRSAATIRQATAAVKSLLTFAHEIGYSSFNPGKVVRAPSVKRTLAERILSREQVLRLLYQEDSPRNRALLLVLYTAALRVSELVGLRWRDVQPRDDTVQLTVHGKGGKTRAVLLPAGVGAAVLELQGDAGADAPVFASRKGGSLDTSAVHRIVRQAAHRAGIDADVSPHWLRHAHASHALDAGAPVHLVQATLGHASLTTTSVYVHARPSESSGRYLAV